MSYRALLFCPDEKTARTVTQVLGELEFAVEACLEPFAAVKKLMGEHFDAVVVDCDNEQNATLLFKSARNSTSNQASLAVAVVEGQAGVAKAFRIGANLVLTKPINIEQSKGTLRVARGLLRKGDPAKPVATSAAGTPIAASPAKPAGPKPVAPVKPPAPSVTATRPAAPVVKPAAPAAKTAVASIVPPVSESALPEISLNEPVAPPAPPRPVLGSHPASIDVTSGFTSSPSTLPASSFASGAASAPAPAREIPAAHPVAASPEPAVESAVVLDKPVEAAESGDSHGVVGFSPSFSFGADSASESSGGSKKIILGVVAAAIVLAGLYFAWSSFQGHSSQPTPAPAPVTIPQAAKPPVSATPRPASTTQPASSSSNSAAQSPAPVEDAQSAIVSDSAAEAKPGSSSAGKTGKSAASKAEASPLVVKGGSAPSGHAKSAAADAAAPSVLAIATPGSSAPPLNLGSGASNAPAPVLQMLNVSQGVSQGLLVKKVQPQYPKNALTMHVEGAVQLTATVSPTGNITSVKVLSGDSQLTKAAIDAVKQWKYKPYLLNGEPVEIQTEITVNFKLPH